MVNATLNTYSVVTQTIGIKPDHRITQYYIQARISGARRYCGDGAAGKAIAEEMCGKWNAATKKYQQSKEGVTA